MTSRCFITSPDGSTQDVESFAAVFHRKAGWYAAGNESSCIAMTVPLTKSGGYSLTLDNIKWECSVYRSRAVDSQRSTIDIAAGNDSIDIVPKSRHFEGPTVRQVANYLLSQAGEQLSPLSDTVLLGQAVGKTFTINSETTWFRQLYILLEQFGGVSRWLPNGTVFITQDKQPTAFVVPADWVLLPAKPHGMTEYWVQTLASMPQPGQLDPVSNTVIEHVILAVNDMRITVSISTEDFFDDVTGYAAAKTNEKGSYAATVVNQLRNWRVQVVFDDSTLFADGLTEVPIRTSHPLSMPKVAAGTRVGVKFDDAGHPYIDGFESKFATSQYPGNSQSNDGNCQYIGDPNKALPVSRVGDATKTLFPTAWQGTLYYGPIVIAGGSTPCIIVLDQPLNSFPDPVALITSLSPTTTIDNNELPGLVMTGTDWLMADDSTSE